MPDSVPPQEDASLYVLNLLEGPDLKAFEANLAQSADLQRQVRELQVNLEALALAAPPRVPRPQVWEAIAKETTPEPEKDVPWWMLFCGYLRNGWAVATLVAVAWLGYALSRPDVNRMTLAARSRSSPADASHPETGVADPSSRRDAAPATSAQARVASPHPGTVAASNTAESQPLKDRVRVLSEQVAVLTQVLAQRTVLPPGSSQLRVFRLIGTNMGQEHLDAFATEAPRLRSETVPTDLSFALTLAAARQLAATTPPKESTSTSGSHSSSVGGSSSSDPNSSSPSDTTTVTASTETSSVTEAGNNTGLVSDPTTQPTIGETGSEVATLDPTTTAPSFAANNNPVNRNATETDSSTSQDSAIQIVDLSGDVSFTSGSFSFGNLVATPEASTGSTSKSASTAIESMAFGTYEMETGFGSIAFRNSVDPGESGVLQLWVTDTHSGAIQSVGFTRPTNPVVVMRFRTDPTLFVNPNFLVTLEPEGGSATPTGPVVVQPPPAFTPPAEPKP